MKKINLITPDEIATIDRIREDCGKLHIMQPPVAKWKVETFNGQGEQTFDIESLSKSWVRNYYNRILMVSIFPNDEPQVGSTYSAGSTRTKTINNTIASSLENTIYAGGLNVIAGAGAVDRGIIVGTSDVAESFDDYKIDTIVSHGNNAGQMSYSSMVRTLPVYNSELKKWTQTLERILNNNSGADITVKEIGIYVYNQPSGLSLLMSRDILTTPVVVANAGQLKVTYTIEMTFPA